MLRIHGKARKITKEHLGYKRQLIADTANELHVWKSSSMYHILFENSILLLLLLFFSFEEKNEKRKVKQTTKELSDEKSKEKNCFQHYVID